MTASRADKARPLEIGGTLVQPGTRELLEIPLARLPTGTQETLPIMALNGRLPGKRVWLSGAIHGDEVNGVEVIRRVLAKLNPKNMHGAVIAVPIVNVFGFIYSDRYLPDRRDLNRSFPGSANGSMAGRLAYLFMKEVVAKCEYGVDLHTGSGGRANTPQIRADLSNPETRRCAVAFGAPVMMHARLRDGSLREAATSKGVHMLLFEGGEALRFDEEAIVAGVHGVLRLLAYLGIRRPKRAYRERTPFEPAGSQWVRARAGGILHLSKRPGDRVQSAQSMGIITTPFGDEVFSITAPKDGVILGAQTTHIVNKGDAVVNLAFA